VGDDDPLLRVAANIRRLRLELGLTQDVLAEEAAMDAAEIRRFEAGRRDPGIRVLTRLAHGLGVRPAELLEGVE
jgi:transcriptional regulator with XRE-family HTH domain